MLEPSHNAELPEIPAKRYFTIGEVSELCEVKPHVLRYWEQEFSQLRPVKRRGNRRYYQRQDVMLIRQIRALLYEQGFTIGGARQQMAGGVPAAVIVPMPEYDDMQGKGSAPALRVELIREMIEEIEEALGYLD
ncbi:MAG: MerR family transcriptional regulator [Pseudomonadales bacterium]|jgi:DNA-binding transcriptional MerR regulator|nr:MerR family transcriptional regulator [Pseudomonadales bacterium]